jgi:hypothetical protein
MANRIVMFLAMVGLLGASTTARAQEFPTGTFSAKLGGDKWSIRFDGKGTFTVLLKDEKVVEGMYKATKNEVVFSKEKGKFAGPEEGKYKWKLDGKKLSFTKIADESEGRSKALTSGPWTREDKAEPEKKGAARRAPAHRQAALRRNLAIRAAVEPESGAH